MKKLFIASALMMLTVGFLIVFVAIPFSVARTIPNEVRLTSCEFEATNPFYIPHSRFMQQNTNAASAVDEDGERFVEIKLFGLIPIKKVRVDILPFSHVHPGGNLLGFMAKIDGVMVTADAPEHKLKKGDIIRTANGRTINEISCFDEVYKQARREITLEVLRGNKAFTTRIALKQEYGNSGEGTHRPLGLWLKDETTGVGTLTYVNPQNNNFASLGHRMRDFETSTSVNLRGGTVHNSKVIGIDKSAGKKIGAYKTIFDDGYKSGAIDTTPSLSGSRGGSAQGSIISSNSFGVYGCLFNDNTVTGEHSTMLPLASRYNVRPGKAKMRTTLDGVVQEFDIEIIKTRFQKTPKSKSMVIRVTDKDLLERSGGIIHGMSGSPIIQDGKVVGALTHVFMSDPTKGYGIYIDFVIP